MDFVVDGLTEGRIMRILSMVGAYTRERLAPEADFNLGSGRVTSVLQRVIAERGWPEEWRPDKGPEFTLQRMIGWAENRKVGLKQSSGPSRRRMGMSRASTAACAASTSTQTGSAP